MNFPYLPKEHVGQMTDTRTPHGFRAARLALGLGARRCAALLGMGTHGERTIRRYEAGETRVNGPAALLIAWLAYGDVPTLGDKNE